MRPSIFEVREFHNILPRQYIYIEPVPISVCIFISLLARFTSPGFPVACQTSCLLLGYRKPHRDLPPLTAKVLSQLICTQLVHKCNWGTIKVVCSKYLKYTFLIWEKKYWYTPMKHSIYFFWESLLNFVMAWHIIISSKWFLIVIISHYIMSGCSWWFF